ncbi:MAG: hypothetical protein OXG06_05180 [Gammaproteobacteria bacterium]|nr:hypothetical protein [Gammaproteobacteria bacterium]
MNQQDFKKISLKQFQGAVKAIMLGGKPETKAENRMPTKAELNKKWKLVRR